MLKCFASFFCCYFYKIEKFEQTINIHRFYLLKKPHRIGRAKEERSKQYHYLSLSVYASLGTVFAVPVWLTVTFT